MNHRGFTLIELMVTLCVLGIVLTLAIPSLTTTIDSVKLKADASEMAGVLRTARQQAVTSGKPRWVVFYPQNGKYRFYSNGTEKINYSLNDGIEIFGGTSFTEYFQGLPGCKFDPSGAPGKGGTVALKNRQGNVLYVIVNPAAGRVRVSKDSPVNW